MNLYAASMLIPVGVIMYTAHGGLKATFMSTYLHTVVVFIALCLFAFEIYATPSTGLGSPSVVWDHLTDIATLGGAYKGPVADNKGGSYLTMFSKSGFIFGIINIIGNFGEGAESKSGAVQGLPFSRGCMHCTMIALSSLPATACSAAASSADPARRHSTPLLQALCLLTRLTGWAPLPPSPPPPTRATSWVASCGSPSPSPWLPPWAWPLWPWICPSPPPRPAPAWCHPQSLSSSWAREAQSGSQVRLVLQA